jgi:RNA-directed DNA polymerase
VLQRLETWRHAGLLDGKALVCPDQGSPHGAGSSPLLANVYVHEGRETWGATVGRAHCRGQVVRWRLADDCGMGCEVAEEARRRQEVLPKRFAQYGLESPTDKPTVGDCGRPQRSAAGRKPGPCSFRGVVHSWGTTWRGGDPSTRKPEGKRLRRILGEDWRWCWDHRHRPLQAQYAVLCAQRRGSCQSSGIRCNSPCLDVVHSAATRAWHSGLHRRGGRQRTWRAFGRMMAA